MHTATPWHTSTSSLGIHTYIEASIGNGFLQEIASCGPTEGPEGSSGNAAFIVLAANAHDDLVAALNLVLSGLDSGSVKAKPIIDFSSKDAESLEMVSLASVIRAALAKATK